MKRANRWFLYGPYLVAALLLLGWFLLWRAGGEAMRRGLAEFAAEQADAGVSVDYAAFTTRGFPFFLRGVVDELSIAKGDDRFAAKRLYVDALPYAPNRLIVSPKGALRVASKGQDWAISADAMRGSAERDKKRGWLVKVESGPLSATNGVLQLSIGKILINLAPSADKNDALDASARIMAVDVLSPAGKRYLFEQLDAAALIGAVSAADGRRPIDIRGAELAFDGAIIAATGTVFLDAAGAPSGRLEAEIDGTAGLSRLIARSPLLKPEETAIAVAGLSTLSPSSGKTISAPIDIESGEISIGGVKIARLERLVQP